MRHRKVGRKFGRVTKKRRSLLGNLAVSLIVSERIRTTEAKAKEIRPRVEKLVTKAGEGGLYVRRILLSRLMNHKPAVSKLIDDLGPRYKGRPGGYLRIVKLAPRLGDRAEMAQIEFVDQEK